MKRVLIDESGQYERKGGYRDEERRKRGKERCRSSLSSLIPFHLPFFPLCVRYIHAICPLYLVFFTHSPANTRLLSSHRVPFCTFLNKADHFDCLHFCWVQERGKKSGMTQAWKFRAEAAALGEHWQVGAVCISPICNPVLAHSQSFWLG